MRSDEALLACHTLWAPYVTEAERLGFGRLEENIWAWNERGGKGYSAHLFLFRSPTFLDLHATIVDGAAPRGTRHGFRGLQLYTFHRPTGQPVQMVLTNGGSPEDLPSRIGEVLDHIFTTPPDHKTYRMIGAHDLTAVIERHLRVVGTRTPLIPCAPVLEQRWEWMKEIENADDECC